MRWLLVLVLVAGCERQARPRLWHAPKVGERRSSLHQFSGTIDGPDGRPHTLERVVEATFETLAVDGEYPTRTRVAFVRDEGKLDGVPKSTMKGTFEVADSGEGDLDVTRVDGTISPEERAFFTDSWHGSRRSLAALKRFTQQTFKPGQRIRLTPDEIDGLGLKMLSVDLTVKDFTAQAAVFQIDSVADFSELDATLKATGTLRIFEAGQELTQDAELTHDGKHLGTLRIDLRSAPL